MTTPFFQWVGGKRQLLSDILPLIHSAMTPEAAYHEPFLGGGAVFFALEPQRAMLSDTNAALISAYQAVQSDTEVLITALATLCARRDRSAFLEARDAFNASPSPELFVYLTRLGFNGLWRVNRSGKLNTPYGTPRTGDIVRASQIRAACIPLATATLTCQTWEQSLLSVQPGDVVYFDPPYLAKGAEFTAYAAPFGEAEHVKLRDACRTLTERGVRFVLSNSHCAADLYTEFTVQEVGARRSVNCKGNGRGKVSEILVRNF